ncbi:MAG: pyrimidine dimer DNA glycosylase/endonuclease V [Candidatus Bathyarchaeota archaeon]|nr:pyrimidine dimer DNA glycosylase/endonuclease V [Candidatus Bathyarchaeum sp.]
MRMWMVDPKIMCRQHLLGEHVEIHMFIGTLCHGKTVKGYLEKGLLEVHSMYARHEELVEEMKRRGYNHCSDVDEKWQSVKKLGFVDKKKSLEDLLKRCSRCERRYKVYSSS